MSIHKNLEPLVEEYLIKQNFHHISISILGCRDTILIMDSFKIFLTDTTNFSLSIIFTFNDQTKKGQAKLLKVNNSSCFENFQRSRNGRNLTLMMPPSNNRTVIVDKVVAIIENIFPNVDTSAISFRVIKDSKMTVTQNHKK